MSNEADLGNEAAELFLNAAMAKQQSAGYKRLSPVGHCYFCDSPVTRGAIFCEGNECRDDWDREQRIRRIAGKWD